MRFIKTSSLLAFAGLALLSGSSAVNASVTVTDVCNISPTQGMKVLDALTLGTNNTFYAAGYNGGLPAGGPNNLDGNDGTIFSVTPLGAVNVLHTFTGADDGSLPPSSLTEGPDGNYYGVASMRGAWQFLGPKSGFGTIFRVTPSGQFTTLYSFTSTSGIDGATPYSKLVVGTDGDLYGTTMSSGALDSNGQPLSNRGSVFRITPSGALTTLHFFNGTDGAGPTHLILGNDGNFYGVTISGGTHSAGTLFRMTPAGAVTVIYNFGGVQAGSIVQGFDGNFYVTTGGGGAHNMGTVLRITPAGVVTILHSFDGADGRGPTEMTVGMDGSLYGVTEIGGLNNTGTVYNLTTGGAFTSLYSLPASGDAQPEAGVRQYADGTFFDIPLYVNGGTGMNLFKLTYSAAVPDTNPVPTVGVVCPNSAVAGTGNTVITITGTNFVGGSVVKWKGNALATTYSSGSQLLAVVPASDLATAGAAAVSVTNPGPGGGTSASLASFTITPTVAPAVPAAPTGLRALARDGSAVLAWTASTGATSYRIHLGTGTLSGITNTQRAVLGLTDGKAYTFTVNAVNSAGSSAASTPVTVTPVPVITATAGVDQVTLSWPNWKAAAYAGTYTIYRSKSPTGTFAGLTDTSGSTSFVDTAAGGGITYYYYVAVAGGNDYPVAISPVVSATPLPGPATHFTVTTPVKATSGVAFNFTVTALDKNGGVATGYPGQITFSTNFPQAVLPTKSGLTNGVGTFQATFTNNTNQLELGRIVVHDVNNSSASGVSNNVEVFGTGS